MSNPLLLKSGATTALVLHMPQKTKGTSCHNVMPLYGGCQLVLRYCQRSTIGVKQDPSAGGLQVPQEFTGFQTSVTS